MQFNVMVFEPLGTAVLPLAATLPTVSVMDQFNVSADGALVVKASWKVLPEAKMRVPSALGVSAEMTALPEPAEMAGAAQPNVALGLADRAEEDELPFAPAALLAWVAALPPPPPPQPASANESVESRSRCDFIKL
ncbi:hypothetical protein [Paraburkholderia lacunae]|uniref:hypothetical protein n=1 Tax=Paraburkholderia lacunae TaxID=2211104 RepID=UPI001FCAE602|nr:hypothetical protein [Paraburkholderia lacunae]